MKRFICSHTTHDTTHDNLPQLEPKQKTHDKRLFTHNVTTHLHNRLQYPFEPAQHASPQAYPHQPRCSLGWISYHVRDRILVDHRVGGHKVRERER